MVLLVSHVSGSRRTWCVGPCVTRTQLLHALTAREGVGGGVVLQCGGRVVTDATVLPPAATVTATLRLCGGKGGFGSMLRAIGAQIEKTTNREACRDLSGRRLRDINEEKRLKDFISKKAERERERLERRKAKFEKLKEQPRHVFQDESYYQQREVREKNLYDSLDKAFAKGEAGPSGSKRTCEAQPVAKPKKGRFMDDLDDSSDDDSGSDDDSKPTSSDEGCRSDAKDEQQEEDKSEGDEVQNKDKSEGDEVQNKDKSEGDEVENKDKSEGDEVENKDKSEGDEVENKDKSDGDNKNQEGDKCEAKEREEGSKMEVDAGYVSTKEDEGVEVKQATN